MFALRPTPRASALAIALVGATLLAGCDRRAPTSPVARAVTPLPPYPAWASPLMGKYAGSALPTVQKCEGAFDVVTVLHTGTAPGVQLEGWAWDDATKAPVSRILVVTPDMRIVGAGVGGFLRTDVPAALPQVTTPKVGWRASAGVRGGVLSILGMPADGVRCLVSTGRNISKDLAVTNTD